MSEQEPVLEQCDYMHLHEKVIEQVQEEMPEEEILYNYLKSLEILPESKFCTCCFSQKCVYAILRSF